MEYIFADWVVNEERKRVQAGLRRWAARRALPGNQSVAPQPVDQAPLPLEDVPSKANWLNKGQGHNWQDPKEPPTTWQKAAEPNIQSQNPWLNKTPQQQPPKMGFSQQDVRQLKEALRDFMGNVDFYISNIARQFPIANQLKQKHLDAPTKQITDIVIPWLDMLLSQSTAEKTNKVPAQQVYGLESVVIEAVKVNYKKFDQVKSVVKNYTSSIKAFQEELMAQTMPGNQKNSKLLSRLGWSSQYRKLFASAYNKYVVMRFENLKQVFTAFGQKINMFLKSRGI